MGCHVADLRQPRASTVLPEAPVRMNTLVTIAGRQVQITLRGVDETEVLARLETLLARSPVAQAVPEQAHGEDWRSLHRLTMK